jgi:hypothetical protein
MRTAEASCANAQGTAKDIASALAMMRFFMGFTC